MSGSSRFDLSGRNFTLIHCSESFVESCQTLRVALPSGLIVLLTVLPFSKVIQSSRQQEVRIDVINETENDLLLVVNFGRSKRPNTAVPQSGDWGQQKIPWLISYLWGKICWVNILDKAKSNDKKYKYRDHVTPLSSTSLTGRGIVHKNDVPPSGMI